MAPAPLDLRCPQCGRDDMVRKVSAIVAGETAVGNYTGRVAGGGPVVGGNGGTAVMAGTTSMSGVTQTMLSRRLQAPTKTQFGLGTNPFAKDDYQIAGFWAAVVAIGIFFMTENSLPVKVGVVILAIGFVIVYRAICNRIWRKWESDGLPRYQAAFDQWNSNYYCGRCDQVFTPDPALTSSLNQ